MNWWLTQLFVCSLLLAPTFGASVSGNVKATSGGVVGLDGLGAQDKASLELASSASASASQNSKKETNHAGFAARPHGPDGKSSSIEASNAAASADASTSLRSNRTSSDGSAQREAQLSLSSAQGSSSQFNQLLLNNNSLGISIPTRQNQLALNGAASTFNNMSFSQNQFSSANYSQYLKERLNDNIPTALTEETESQLNNSQRINSRADVSQSASASVETDANTIASSDGESSSGLSLAGNAGTSTGASSDAAQSSSISAAANASVNTTKADNKQTNSAASAAENVTLNTASPGNRRQNGGVWTSGNAGDNAGMSNGLSQIGGVWTGGNLGANAGTSNGLSLNGGTWNGGHADGNAGTSGGLTQNGGRWTSGSTGASAVTSGGMTQNGGSWTGGNAGASVGTSGGLTQNGGRLTSGSTGASVGTSGGLTQHGGRLTSGSIGASAGTSGGVTQNGGSWTGGNTGAVGTSGGLTQNGGSWTGGNAGATVGTSTPTSAGLTQNSGRLTSGSTGASAGSSGGVTQNGGSWTGGNAGATVGTSTPTSAGLTQNSGRLTSGSTGASAGSSGGVTQNGGSWTGGNAGASLGISSGLSGNSGASATGNVTVGPSLTGDLGLNSATLSNLRPNLGASTTAQANGSVGKNRPVKSNQAGGIGLNTGALLQDNVSSGSIVQTNRHPLLTDVTRLLKVIEVVSNVSNEVQFAPGSGQINNYQGSLLNLGGGANANIALTSTRPSVGTQQYYSPSAQTGINAAANSQVNTRPTTYNLGVQQYYSPSTQAGINATANSQVNTRPTTSNLGVQQYYSPSTQIGINAAVNSQVNTRPTTSNLGVQQYYSPSTQAGINATASSQMNARPTTPNFGGKQYYSPNIQAGLNVAANSQINARPTVTSLETQQYSNSLSTQAGVNAVSNSQVNTRPAITAIDTQQYYSPLTQAGINSVANSQVNLGPATMNLGEGEYYNVPNNQFEADGGSSATGSSGINSRSLRALLGAVSLLDTISALSEINNQDDYNYPSSNLQQWKLGAGANGQLAVANPTENIAGTNLNYNQTTRPTSSSGLNANANAALNQDIYTNAFNPELYYAQTGQQGGINLNGGAGSNINGQQYLGDRLSSTWSGQQQSQPTSGVQAPSQVNQLKANASSSTNRPTLQAGLNTNNAFQGNLNAQSLVSNQMASRPTTQTAFVPGSQSTAFRPTTGANASATTNANIRPTLQTGLNTNNLGGNVQSTQTGPLASQPSSTWSGQQQTPSSFNNGGLTWANAPSQGSQVTAGAGMNANAGAITNVRPTLQSGSGFNAFGGSNQNAQSSVNSQMTGRPASSWTTQPQTQTQSGFSSGGQLSGSSPSLSNQFSSNAGFNASTNFLPNSQAGINTNNFVGGNQNAQSSVISQMTGRPASSWTTQPQTQTQSGFSSGGQLSSLSNQFSSNAGFNASTNFLPNSQAGINTNNFVGGNQNAQSSINNQMTGGPTSSWTTQPQTQTQSGFSSGGQPSGSSPSLSNQFSSNAGFNASANVRPNLQAGINTNNIVGGNQNLRPATASQMTTRPQFDQTIQNNQWTTRPTSTWKNQQQLLPDSTEENQGLAFNQDNQFQSSAQMNSNAALNTNVRPSLQSGLSTNSFGGSKQNMQPLQANQWDSRPSSWNNQQAQPGFSSGPQSTAFNPGQNTQFTGSGVLNAGIAANTNARPTQQTGLNTDNISGANTNGQLFLNNQISARPSTTWNSQQQIQPGLTSGGQNTFRNPSQGNQIGANIGMNASAGFSNNVRPNLQSDFDMNSSRETNQNGQALQSNQWAARPNSNWSSQQQLQRQPSSAMDQSSVFTPTQSNQLKINASAGANTNVRPTFQPGSNLNTQTPFTNQMTGRPTWISNQNTQSSSASGGLSENLTPTQANQFTGNSVTNANMRPTTQTGFNMNDFDESNQPFESDQWTSRPSPAWNAQQQAPSNFPNGGQSWLNAPSQGSQVTAGAGMNADAGANTNFRPTLQSDSDFDASGERNQNAQPFLANQMTSRPTSSWTTQPQAQAGQGSQFTSNAGFNASANFRPSSQSGLNTNNFGGNSQNGQPMQTNQLDSRPSPTLSSQQQGQTTFANGAQWNANDQSLLASQMTSRPSWSNQQGTQLGITSGQSGAQGGRFSGLGGINASAAANTNIRPSLLSGLNNNVVGRNDIDGEASSWYNNQLEAQPSQLEGYQGNAQSSDSRWNTYPTGYNNEYGGNQNRQQYQNGQPSPWLNQRQSPYDLTGNLDAGFNSNANMQPYYQMGDQQYQPSNQMTGNMNGRQVPYNLGPSESGYSGAYSSNSYDKSNLRIIEESKQSHKSEYGSNQVVRSPNEGYYSSNAAGLNNYGFGNYLGNQVGFGGQGQGYQQYQGADSDGYYPLSLNTNQQLLGGLSTTGASASASGSTESRAIDKKSLKGECTMDDSSQTENSSKAKGKCDIHESSSDESSTSTESRLYTDAPEKSKATRYSKPTSNTSSKGKVEAKTKATASSGVKLNQGISSTRRGAIEPKSNSTTTGNTKPISKP